jgi:hypothetical protein
MTKDSTTTRIAIAAVLSLGLMLATMSALAAGQSKSGPSGYGPGYGPSGMGPGMMYNWSPKQRQQHWNWMRQNGYGPGMMYNWSPAQRQQHWDWMRKNGYGPGMSGYGPGQWGGPTSNSASKKSGN